jgi:hypothetical protein
VADEEVQCHHQGCRDADEKDVFGGEQYLRFEAHEIAQDVDGREDIGIQHLAGSLPVLGDIGQDERGADSGDQGGETGGTS